MKGYANSQTLEALTVNVLRPEQHSQLVAIVRVAGQMDATANNQITLNAQVNIVVDHIE
jgi:hypothetical protein